MSPPVGFRFHPTEEEIITYYLKLKLNGQDELVDDIIGEIDVYRREPWDLPDFARMTSDDLVWYFFCRLELLYGNSARANRKTENGFWKVTGKSRDIKAKATGRVIGTKKTVVFYFKGGDSKPIRTDWVIHEYQPKTHINPLNPIVLCKLKNKSDEVAGNDEGEASIQVASDGENPATFVVGTEDLQSINLGDNMESNLPTVLTDDEDVDLAVFADSFFADPDELHDDNSFIPAMWSSNMHSGETSANHHRQVQSTRHDDILLMRASSEDSDAPRHNMIAHLSSTSEEHPKTHIHQGQSKSINLISQVSPRVIQSPRYELQADFSSMVSRDRVASHVKKENPPIDRHRASSFAAVPQEERMVWRVRAESRVMKENPPIDRPPSRFPAVAPIQKPKEPEKRKAPEKPKVPLGPIVSTSRDRGCGFIRMETIMASDSPTPTSVQLCNAIVGVFLLFFIICCYYTELC